MVAMSVHFLECFHVKVFLSIHFPQFLQVVLSFYSFFFSQWRFQGQKISFVSSSLMFILVWFVFLLVGWGLLPFQGGALEFQFRHCLLLPGLPQFPVGGFHGGIRVVQFVGAYRAQLNIPKLFVFGSRPFYY
jgi:hypothetical protein